MQFCRFCYLCAESLHTVLIHQKLTKRRGSHKYRCFLLAWSYSFPTSFRCFSPPSWKTTPFLCWAISRHSGRARSWSNNASFNLWDDFFVFLIWPKYPPCTVQKKLSKLESKASQMESLCAVCRNSDELRARDFMSISKTLDPLLQCMYRRIRNQAVLHALIRLCWCETYK